MENKSKEQKIHPAAWAALVVGIVLLAVGAYYFLTQEDENTNNTNTVATTNTTVNENADGALNANTTSNTNEVANINTEIDTSDWQLYQFSGYDINLKLPTDWSVEKEPIISSSFKTDTSVDDFIISPPNNDLDFQPAANCYISVFPYGENDTINTWLQESGIYVIRGSGEGLNIIEQNEQSIGQYSGVYVREGAGGPQETASFYFLKGNNLFRFSYYKGVVVEPYRSFQEYSNICLSISETLY